MAINSHSQQRGQTRRLPRRNQGLLIEMVFRIGPVVAYAAECRNLTNINSFELRDSNPINGRLRKITRRF